jgi:NAD(P)-dependent dehydrogenase (short-subunit alcohol dehydrogenase family)
MYVLAHSRKQGGGAIVNTSSGAGVIGIKGSPAYAAAKHGVLGLTKAAALDYTYCNDGTLHRRHVRRTREGHSRGRMGTPEEIAAAVLWLCSDAAAFMIGHAMVVDGGQTIQ